MTKFYKMLLQSATGTVKLIMYYKLQQQSSKCTRNFFIILQGANEDCGMRDLLISLRKEITKWEEGEEEYEREKEEEEQDEDEEDEEDEDKEDEEDEKEEDDSAKENIGKVINFIKKFQELLQLKVKVHDLIYFHLIMFV